MLTKLHARIPLVDDLYECQHERQGHSGHRDLRTPPRIKLSAKLCKFLSGPAHLVASIGKEG